MDYQRATSLSNKVKQTCNTMGQRGLPYMGEAQIQAYLIARDVLRRIRRTASLGSAPPSALRELRVRAQSAQQ